MEATGTEKPNITLFDVKSIIEFLDGLGLKVTAKDLKTPSIEILITIYKKFLECCVSLVPTTFDAEPSDCGLHFDQDTLKVQSESFKFMQIYLLAKYYFDMCGLDPAFNDIFMPTKKLMVKQLSTMINFARFEFLELNDFSSVQQDNKQFLEDCDRLRRETDEYRIKVNYLNSKKAEEKQDIENARKRISALKEKIIVAKEQRKKVAANTDIVKKEHDSIQAEEEQHKLREKEIRKKTLLYEKLLVRSPERLNKELQKNSARICELEKLNKAKQAENDDLRRNLFDRQKFVDEFDTVIKSLEKFYSNDVLKANEKIKEIEQIKEQIMTLNFQIKEYESLINTMIEENDKLKATIIKEKNRTEKELVQLQLMDDSMIMQIDEMKVKLKEANIKRESLIEEKARRIEQANEFQSLALANLAKIQMDEVLRTNSVETSVDLISQMDASEDVSFIELVKKYGKLFDFLKDV